MSADSVSGNGRILLVDDEDLVRNAVTRMLQGLGYEVTAVANGADAIRYFEEFHAGIDLVMIDLAMPDMSGHDCFLALKKIDPAVRAILSTGFGADAGVRAIIGDGLMGIIQKPYTMKDLSEIVAGALRE